MSVYNRTHILEPRLVAFIAFAGSDLTVPEQLFVGISEKYDLVDHLFSQHFELRDTIHEEFTSAQRHQTIIFDK